MDEATARTRLESMVASGTDPVLTTAQVDDLLALAKRVDAYGVAPSDASWVPTYDLNAAAAEGWRWKAAAAAARVDVSEGGDQLSRSQTAAACLEMAERYDARTLGSLRMTATPVSWDPVIGNID